MIEVRFPAHDPRHCVDRLAMCIDAGIPIKITRTYTRPGFSFTAPGRLEHVVDDTTREDVYRWHPAQQ